MLVEDVLVNAEHLPSGGVGARQHELHDELLLCRVRHEDLVRRQLLPERPLVHHRWKDVLRRERWLQDESDHWDRLGAPSHHGVQDLSRGSDDEVRLLGVDQVCDGLEGAHLRVSCHHFNDLLQVVLVPLGRLHVFVVVHGVLPAVRGQEPLDPVRFYKVLLFPWREYHALSSGSAHANCKCNHRLRVAAGASCQQSDLRPCKCLHCIP
mmetsp:Transcript_15913/g.62178  ORF Transcript_15913/g.62178 Transcript_15913/m.62178 type:complete len:209 (+) Transcript_15913:916-1542(+)